VYINSKPAVIASGWHGVTSMRTLMVSAHLGPINEHVWRVHIRLEKGGRKPVPVIAAATATAAAAKLRLDRQRRRTTKSCPSEWIRENEDGSVVDQWSINLVISRFCIRTSAQHRHPAVGASLWVPSSDWKRTCRPNEIWLQFA